MPSTNHLTRAAAILLLLSFELAQAGGPRYVAGVSSFNAGTMGTPLTWANGAVKYYTDQGDLSPRLPGPSADAFVAAAFSRWTVTATAAISATRAGQLAEDVNGTNVLVNSDGTITLPADILPTALNQPVAIVYDADGSVTDALLGQTASDPSLCATNSVIGGVDSLSADAHLAHALVVLNGSCAQTSAQLPNLSYHLVRLLGQVLGLDWSQLNLNVLTGQPSLPTTADYAGFPVMHANDPPSCVPISKCYPASADPAQPKEDDQAALSRLYPVTAQNLASFPGKQVLASTTMRIHGSVYFVDATGLPAQPMQGVNVVARWIDPSTGTPSGTYAAACVSGFLFRGNAGNPVTGFNDSSGQRYDRFGSDDPTVEGFFDLAGLQVPSGTKAAQFEVSLEAVDPVWSLGVQPYGDWQVEPSGTTRVFVSAAPGEDVEQDLLMTGSALSTADTFGPTSFAAPAALPASGDWSGSLNPYGDSDYFWFPAQANRTLSVAVTALDESGNASANKAQPVVGMWSLASPQVSPAPAETPSSLNTLITGETRLDAVLNATTNFRLGISDLRGDGRPDFRYHAHVFYGDTISPARASAAGGTPLTVTGFGFRAGDSLAVGAANAPLLAVSSTQILIAAPLAPDGVHNITLQDPATGGTSTMTAALTYGAGPNDSIKLIAGANQIAPAGAQAPNPVVVQVLAADGSTAVAGASVFFVSSPAAALSACGSASSCTVFSDQSGTASTFVTMLSPTLVTITAELAPVSYNPPQQVQAVVNGLSSSLDIGLSPQFAWIAQGATISVPLTARVLSNGAPLAGQTVDYQILKGSGLLTSATAVSDTNGHATSTLQLSALAGDIQVSACVKNVPVDSPCLNFVGTAVPVANLSLHPVAGTLQLADAGQSFSPVVVEVTDNASPPHPVLGATVAVQTIVAREPQNQPIVWIGDTGISGNPQPVILSSSQANLTSDTNGQVTISPSTGSAQGPVLVLGSAGVGSSSLKFELQSLSPVAPPAGNAVAATPISNLRKSTQTR